MPFYRCYVPADSVPFEKRKEVAKAFTDIHCGSTGAPRDFVHVAFFDSAEADYPTQYYIDGGNRAGRPAEVREKLLSDLKNAFVGHHRRFNRPTGRANHRGSGILVHGRRSRPAGARRRGP